MPLPRGFLLLLVVAAVNRALSAPAGDSSASAGPEPDLAPGRTNWRNVVHQEIKFDAAAAAIPAARLPGLREPPPDPDVVTLPTFVVTRKRVEFQDLKRTLDAQAADAKVEGVARKLGIAVHAFHTRHFGAGVVTVFYIPIFAGFGWSW